MFETKSTGFGIMNTPFQHDITGDNTEGVSRGRGSPLEYTFLPDDFHWLHEHNIAIRRNVDEVSPEKNSELLVYDQSQVKELLSQYGPSQC